MICVGFSDSQTSIPQDSSWRPQVLKRAEPLLRVVAELFETRKEGLGHHEPPLLMVNDGDICPSSHNHGSGKWVPPDGFYRWWLFRSFDGWFSTLLHRFQAVHWRLVCWWGTAILSEWRCQVPVVLNFRHTVFHDLMFPFHIKASFKQ